MDTRKISRFFVYFFLTLGALIMLLPFFWMFSSAFKTTQEINRFPPQWFPSRLSLDNFKRAFEGTVCPLLCELCHRYGLFGFDYDIHNDSGGVCIFQTAFSWTQRHFFAAPFVDDDSV